MMGSMTANDLTGSLRAFLEQTVRWRSGLIDASDVVDAAVMAMVEGVESPAFVSVAGLTAGEATAELPELIADALGELGVALPAAGDPDHQVLVAATFAAPLLAGELEAQELTQTIHATYGHECHPLIERLSVLDDEFDALEHVTTSTRDELVEATRLAAAELRDRADAIYRASTA